jgi:hypothetical protein
VRRATSISPPMMTLGALGLPILFVDIFAFRSKRDYEVEHSFVGVPFANRSIRTSGSDFMIRNWFTEKAVDTCGSPASPGGSGYRFDDIALGTPGDVTVKSDGIALFPPAESGGQTDSVVSVLWSAEFPHDLIQAETCWRGGNCLKDWSQCPTNACAGMSR